ALFEQAQAELDKLFPAKDGFQAEVSGDSRMRILANRRVGASQTTGLGIAFVIIFLPIFFVLRSICLGLLSIPSNLFPIVAVLGFMGWVGIRMTPQNTVMASVTLGLVVDDSIHFLQALRDKLQAGMDLRKALESTLRVKFAAVLVSTAV